MGVATTAGIALRELVLFEVGAWHFVMLTITMVLYRLSPRGFSRQTRKLRGGKSKGYGNLDLHAVVTGLVIASAVLSSLC